jgi:hypothetical protein
MGWDYFGRLRVDQVHDRARQEDINWNVEEKSLGTAMSNDASRTVATAVSER